MFKEYWNGHVALGLIVGISFAFNIVGFLSVGFDWVGLEKASTDTYTYAEQQCSRQQAGYAFPRPSLFQYPQPSAADPQARQADRGEDTEPDWCDLAAQQSMADSTAGMEQTAWIALAMSIVGVILLWRTLYYTRETLKETRYTTEYSMQALALERAWVVSNGYKLRTHVNSSIRGKPYKIAEMVELLWENKGRTPAFDVNFYVADKVVPTGSGVPEFISEIRNDNGMMLPPNADVGAMNVAIGDIDLENLRRRSVEWYVYSHVQYRTVHDNELIRESEVCLRFTHGGQSQGPKGEIIDIFNVTNRGPQNRNT